MTTLLTDPSLGIRPLPHQAFAADLRTGSALTRGLTIGVAADAKLSRRADFELGICGDGFALKKGRFSTAC